MPSTAQNLSPFAIPRELGRVSLACARGAFGLPFSVVRSLMVDAAFDGVFSESRLLDLFGDNALRFFDQLGPIYGKAGQITLSRLSPPLHAVADSLRLTRLYKDWPALPWTEVMTILDSEIPTWRTDLAVDAHPLGVASLAQVHAAVDKNGRHLVLKILKPGAVKRLGETTEALERMVRYMQPLAVTAVAGRFLKEVSELCESFRQETSLTRERETIERVRAKLAGKKQRVLLIPEVFPEFCTDRVLGVERFVGVSLAEVVAGKVELSTSVRQKLAKHMLAELLVQVFELGLFHADPHAGNLILTDDGDVGLFDWGLAGELLESDRRFIAAILRSIIALDQDKLIDALANMGEEAGCVVDRDEVRKELNGVIAMIKAGREEGSPRPSLQSMLEACLKSAARLGIPVPDGLLLMAKSLVTIEGLARGIDPDISLARVATPVLIKAAKPGFSDLLALGRRLPALARQMFNA